MRVLVCGGWRRGHAGVVCLWRGGGGHARRHGAHGAHFGTAPYWLLTYDNSQTCLQYI